MRALNQCGFGMVGVKSRLACSGVNPVSVAALPFAMVLAHAQTVVEKASQCPNPAAPTAKFQFVLPDANDT